VDGKRPTYKQVHAAYINKQAPLQASVGMHDMTQVEFTARTDGDEWESSLEGQ
jgi:hypothetical protein